MSSRVVDEVVCQCDHADRAVPPQITKTKLDKLIQKARDLGKEEIVEELKTRWEAFIQTSTAASQQPNWEHQSPLLQDMNYSPRLANTRDCFRTA